MEIVDISLDAGNPIPRLPIISALDAAAEAERAGFLLTGRIYERDRGRSDHAVHDGGCDGIERAPRYSGIHPGIEAAPVMDSGR